VLDRYGQRTVLLVSRGRTMVGERALAAACERADVVIADRWLPRSCRPRRLKADRALLARTGGLALDLRGGRVTTVAESQGTHGWWRPEPPRAWRRKPRPVDTVDSVQKEKAEPAPLPQ
jgi:competence protein ComEC